MSKKNRKHISADRIVPDFGLWAHVSKTVKPVNPDLAKELEKFAPCRPLVRRQPQPPTSKIRLKTGAARLQSNGSLEFTGLNRRQQQRLLRGRVEIDARIDLHGETVESARMKLWQFLASCFDKRLNMVLVITGKGSSQFTRHTLHGRDFHEAAPRSGRLRQAVRDWLHEQEFREFVSGFQPAHPRHGGGGALYIRLRNRDKRIR